MFIAKAKERMNEQSLDRNIMYWFIGIIIFLIALEINITSTMMIGLPTAFGIKTDVRTNAHLYNNEK